MLNTDLIIGFTGLAVGVLTFLVTRDIGPLGKIFVDSVLVALSFFSVLIAIKGFIKPERTAFFDSIVERNNILAGVSILALYLLFMPWIGFLASSYIFYFILTIYLSEDRFSTKNLIQASVFSLIVVTGFYLIFRNVLGVPLPAGSWFAE